MNKQERLDAYLEELNELSERHGFRQVATLQQIATEPVTVQAVITVIEIGNGERTTDS